MRKLYIIGIGVGNPEHITVQAIRALNKVDVFFFMDKGDTKEELLLLRRQICERYIERPNFRTVELPDPVRDPAIPDYTTRVEQWHHARVQLYEQAMLRELRDDQCGAILVWGDPSLYDSTLRIVDQILARGNLALDHEVIPGITSMQALAAGHKIPLHGIGESFLVTTGRQLAAGVPPDIRNVLVMLDAGAPVSDRHNADDDIFWGAYLGMENETLLSGKLGAVAGQIERVRNELRATHGWIMDSYLLRRPKP